MATAVFIRFWQLGNYPPGLYRDEAFNGLDALGVLNGQHAVFFSANNGREPGYIYLTAVAISILGRTPLAVRISAAVVGALTTIPVYFLGKSWFGQKTAVYAAFLWGITLWPVHLSRIGLRPILLPIMLALTFWIGTEAYRKKANWLWLLAGAMYGLGFYTYLAIRFTPLIFVLILGYLWWQKRPFPTWRDGVAFGGGFTAVLLPLLLWLAQDPQRLLGRSNQVSVLNPTINGGDLFGTLWGNIWRGLGLFFWQGDTILRHNPAGRPVFDWVMTIPFIIGVVICVLWWKRPSYTTLLLWTLTMLGPTILAEDTPHFLRAVGILPAAIYFPALGLTKIEEWLATTFSPPHSLTLSLAKLIAPILLTASLAITLTDYQTYAQDPDVALLFETAALELGEAIRAEDENTAVYLDRWFWDDEQSGWPTVPFIADLENVQDYRPEFGVTPPDHGQAVSIYGWQFGSLDFVPTLIMPPAIVQIHTGAQARGDLEENGYPLYINYHAEPPLGTLDRVARLEDQFWLYAPTISQTDEQLTVSLWWEAQTAVSQNWVVFAHLVGPAGLVEQDDAPPANGLWHNGWWQPELIIEDQHHFLLPPNFDPATHYLLVGLYNPETAVRLQLFTPDGEPLGDSWRINIGEQ